MNAEQPTRVRRSRKGPAPKEIPSVQIRIPAQLKPAIELMKQEWYALEKKAFRP